MDLRDKFFVDMIRPHSGCDLAATTPYAMFRGLFVVTNGNPCDGCAHARNCDFLIKQRAHERELKVKNFGKVNFETNAQIAGRLTKEGRRGTVTPRQVSKMRKRGEIP